jgi:RNA polymerase sigma-70 factor (ECF subfamily)
MSRLQTKSDSELLICLRQGDIKAFDELYYRYAKKVMSFALTFFSDREVAKEATQEIFIRIWEKRKTLDATKSFKSYLFQAVKFYMYNYIRDKKQSCPLEEIPEEEYMREGSTSANMEFEELEAKTYSLIKKLPKVQQQVFLLNKIEGLTPVEIAAMMNLSKRTIEHHIYLSTKTVRGMLLQHFSFDLLLFAALWW